MRFIQPTVSGSVRLFYIVLNDLVLNVDNLKMICGEWWCIFMALCTGQGTGEECAECHECAVVFVLHSLDTFGQDDSKV